MIFGEIRVVSTSTVIRRFGGGQTGRDSHLSLAARLRTDPKPQFKSSVVPAQLSSSRAKQKQADGARRGRAPQATPESRRQRQGGGGPSGSRPQR